MKTVILLIQCPDTSGIIAAISRWIVQRGGNIAQSSQYATSGGNGGHFFMRIEFSVPRLEPDFTEAVAVLAASLNGTIDFFTQDQKPRMSILVSHYDHCLFDLLYQWQNGELPVDIISIISNHQTCESLANQYHIPFHYLPIDTKAAQEKQLLSLVQHKTDFLVLARYMQILSSSFLAAYQKDIINIHHSFLPSFVGANPYQQAYARGVKLIGATAHYVTDDLDEGPIIEQMVERVSHRDSPEKLRRKGRNLEKITLSHAVESHIEHRVIRVGNKTIVFD